MKIFITVILMTMTTMVLADEAPVVDLNQNTPQIQQQLSGNATVSSNSLVSNDSDNSASNDAVVAPSSTNEANSNDTGSNATMPQPANSGVSELVNLPINDRVARLEQQMSNLTNMDLPQQITMLRQQMQQLNGQIQVMQHDLKLLNDQQRSFYKDLQQQIDQVKNLNGNASPDNKKPQPKNKQSSTDLDLKEATAYKKAFNLVLNKKYDSAQTALQNYISSFPQGEFQPNAHFWLGEILMMNKQWLPALKQFKVIITQYSNSYKAPDARLKIALINLGLGKVAQAKQELQNIKKKYPSSTAAQLASIQLQQLKAQQAQ